MKTCGYCNMQFSDEDVKPKLVCQSRMVSACVHCQPMVKKMYSDADRSRKYAEQGINQEQLRINRAYEARDKDNGYIIYPYKGAESTHLSAPPRWIND